MGYETLLVEKRGRHVWVRLNRPEVRNAFNEKMIAELTSLFQELDAGDARAIVLAAEGKAFCAGGDLNWMSRMADYTDAENREDARALANMLYCIYSCRKPVIARIHGDCYAGGVGLIAACDLAVAAPDVGFSLSEVRLGLIPATISPYIVRAAGVRAAQRFFLTAERFGPEEALSIGLVHEVAPITELDRVIEGWLQAFESNSPNALAEAKRLLRETSGRLIDEVLIDDTADRIAAIRASEEGKEGVRAFLDKRRPFWVEVG